jgi:hypothetical protein
MEAPVAMWIIRATTPVPGNGCRPINPALFAADESNGYWYKREGSGRSLSSFCAPLGGEMEF